MDSEIKFEKALERLEKIVGDLESGNMPLEEALKKYEEGVKLSRICTQRLEEAETKITVLTRTLSGVLEATSLDSQDGAKKMEGKKAKKREQNPQEKEDELLL